MRVIKYKETSGLVVMAFLRSYNWQGSESHMNMNQAEDRLRMSTFLLSPFF